VPLVTFTVLSMSMNKDISERVCCVRRITIMIGSEQDTIIMRRSSLICVCRKVDENIEINKNNKTKYIDQPCKQERLANANGSARQR